MTSMTKSTNARRGALRRHASISRRHQCRPRTSDIIDIKRAFWSVSNSNSARQVNNSKVLEWYSTCTHCPICTKLFYKLQDDPPPHGSRVCYHRRDRLFPPRYRNRQSLFLSLVRPHRPIVQRQRRHAGGGTHRPVCCTQPCYCC